MVLTAVNKIVHSVILYHYKSLYTFNTYIVQSSVFIKNGALHCTQKFRKRVSGNVENSVLCMVCKR